jgi:uncharacterized membrane protein
MDETLTQSTHLEDTFQAIARVRAEHNRKATLLERIVDKLTGRAGRPGFVVLLTLIIVSWVCLNSGSSRFLVGGFEHFS